MVVEPLDELFVGERAIQSSADVVHLLKTVVQTDDGKECNTRSSIVVRCAIYSALLGVPFEPFLAHNNSERENRQQRGGECAQLGSSHRRGLRGRGLRGWPCSCESVHLVSNSSCSVGGILEVPKRRREIVHSVLHTDSCRSPTRPIYGTWMRSEPPLRGISYSE